MISALSLFTDKSTSNDESGKVRDRSRFFTFVEVTKFVKLALGTVRNRSSRRESFISFIGGPARRRRNNDKVEPLRKTHERKRRVHAARQMAHRKSKNVQYLARRGGYPTRNNDFICTDIFECDDGPKGKKQIEIFKENLSPLSAFV